VKENDMRDDELNGAKILEKFRLKNLAGKKNLIEDLKKRKSPRSISLLVEMLQDESWYLREQAVQALSDAGDEAKEPVLEVLENGLWYARAASAKVLGKIGGVEAVVKLTDCLLDSNMTVQGAAAAALVDIARSSSVENLASPLASSSHDVKQKAVACLSLLDKEIADGVVACWERAIAQPGSEKTPDPGPSEEDRSER
jgi:HEAT repeat protein